MDPHAFVAEVYRRMSLRHEADRRAPSWDEARIDARVLQSVHETANFLPKNKSAPILDLGFGGGWFLAGCLLQGYRTLSGADFGIENKAFVKAWAPDVITLWQIENDVGTFLADKPEQYDFIHMSHVIEHIPKYSLLWVVDAVFRALRPGGTLMLRTPNMEGPCANSCLYVTLAHEYGFSSGNLASLLDICGFDAIRFHPSVGPSPGLKQKLGRLLRRPYLRESEIRHRLFGVNEHGRFEAELVVTATRGSWTPFFDPKYR